MLASWLAGPSDVDKRSKFRSLLKKYFTFCVDTNVPVFPLTLVQLMCYVIWLPKHDILGGWSVVTNYTGAICTLNKRLGHGDPRDDNPALWEEVRKRFADEVQVIRNHKVKLLVSPGYLEALALDTLTSPSPRRTEHMACDSVMYFGGVRVGHFAPKATKRAKHVLRWKHLVFMPCVEDCKVVFIRVQTSKTRQGTELRPYWTAVGRQLNSPLVCPTRWLCLHFKTNYLGRAGSTPNDPIFTTARGDMLNRTAYQKELQTRLLRAVTTHLPQAGFDVRHYTGISWRKATASGLLGKVADSKVANAMDHQNIETTRRSYAEDTIEERANVTSLAGADFTSLANMLARSS